jgi:predicted RNA-binding Zn-ribbon protein involved in translation (DUF1610 family)
MVYTMFEPISMFRPPPAIVRQRIAADFVCGDGGVLERSALIACPHCGHSARKETCQRFDYVGSYNGFSSCAIWYNK